ncbi:PilN domain-containing protein [Planococcus lenghuensis]|uniref:Fimbrial assembly protein n=1 Tax=Planococcus lenghuensis TaxID=2213202 RepID=A0A1Q2KXL6_9BACL|nr:hypothetical protein [Planococcus lenghuensis]AQQ52893.1 hypothetical protein B0X71_07185 [Planococcus lenghuensis]
MLVDINLLPQKERNNPTVIIAVIALLFAALLLWIVFFFLTKSEENQQQLLLAESQELAALQTELRDEIAMRSGLSEEQELQATVTWAQSYQYDTVPLLTELASLLPARGFFQTFTYTGPNTAKLDVQFDNAREAAFYLTHLKNSELLSDVSLLSVATEDLVTEEAEEEVDEEDTMILPRYVASYEMTFVDERIPATDAATVAGETLPATTADVPVDGTAPVEPVPASEAALAEQAPAEEVPADE